MPAKTANYVVQLTGYDPTCKTGVISSLLKNHPSKGRLWARELLKRAKAGEHPTVYESNGEADAWAKARHLMLSGAKVALFAVAEDGTLTPTSIAT
jgi:hypothetical protein